MVAVKTRTHSEILKSQWATAEAFQRKQRF